MCRTKPTLTTAGFRVPSQSTGRSSSGRRRVRRRRTRGTPRPKIARSADSRSEFWTRLITAISMASAAAQNRVRKPSAMHSAPTDLIAMTRKTRPRRRARSRNAPSSRRPALATGDSVRLPLLAPSPEPRATGTATSGRCGNAAQRPTMTSQASRLGHDPALRLFAEAAAPFCRRYRGKHR